MQIKIMNSRQELEDAKSLSPFGRTYASILKKKYRVHKISNANAQYAKNYNKQNTNVITSKHEPGIRSKAQQAKKIVDHSSSFDNYLDVLLERSSQ